MKLRNGQVSTQEHHTILKQELTRRDDTIQQLRREVLHLQERRDHVQTEVCMSNLIIYYIPIIFPQKKIVPQNIVVLLG